MGIIRGLEHIAARHRGAAITIGNFDGVHLGHRKILAKLVERARSLGTRALAVTFDPHPVKVLVPDHGLKLITLPEERGRLLREAGADAVLFIPFSREFASLTAEEFISEVLVKRLGVKAIVVGQGYSFGRGKKGNTELLRRRGRKYGYSVSVVRIARGSGEAVSSSRIREAITRGAMPEAAAMLGRPYMIEGDVGYGAGRGDKVLHTPTANIVTMNELIPKQGVYAVRVEHKGATHDAVASIGINPTFTPDNKTLSCEVHLLDFRADLRGERLRLHFVERLRGERVYPSAEALMKQIGRDIAKARTVLFEARQ